jgi:hypothetical protein
MMKRVSLAIVALAVSAGWPLQEMWLREKQCSRNE